MAKQEKTIEVTIDLPDDFSATLKEAAADEIRIAEDKWLVRLVPDVHQEIVNHALAQLTGKVALSAKRPWGVDEKHLRVSIATPPSYDGRRFYSLPGDTKAAEKVHIIRSHDGWILSDERESADESFPLSEFHTVLPRLVITWFRTAIFYGVGSYDDNA